MAGCALPASRQKMLPPHRSKSARCCRSPAAFNSMSMVSAILLTGYFALALSAFFSPSNAPQQGMSQGFITLVALVLLLFGGALWFGVARQHPWVVREGGARNDLPCRGRMVLLQRKFRGDFFADSLTRTADVQGTRMHSVLKAALFSVPYCATYCGPPFFKRAGTAIRTSGKSKRAQTRLHRVRDRIASWVYRVGPAD
jgi:hypothetical protein